MNIPKHLLDYYRLLNTTDDTKHPINFIKPNIVLTDTEETIYFKKQEDGYKMNSIVGGKEQKIKVY